MFRPLNRRHLQLFILTKFFLRCFRDPIRVPRIREKYHRVLRIRENRVPRIREIGSLPDTNIFQKKNPDLNHEIVKKFFHRNTAVSSLISYESV